MAWVYDPSAHRYVDGDRLLTERQLLDLRNAIADGMSTEAKSLARQLIDGVITFAQWAKAFAKLIRDGITAGFLLGRGGQAQLTAVSTKTLDALVADQLGYAKSFASVVSDLIDAGTATVDGVGSRSALYAGASVQAFHQGQSEDWRIELPYYPADGETECLGNCRCSWEVTDTDTEVTAIWRTEDDHKVCEDCEARGKEYGPDSPFVQSKGNP
jgi:hypothetical protein